MIHITPVDCSVVCGICNNKVTESYLHLKAKSGRFKLCHWGVPLKFLGGGLHNLHLAWFMGVSQENCVCWQAWTELISSVEGLSWIPLQNGRHVMKCIAWYGLPPQ